MSFERSGLGKWECDRKNTNLRCPSSYFPLPTPVVFIYFCGTSGGVASIHSSTECHTRCRCYCDSNVRCLKIVTTHELGSWSCRLNHECTVVQIQLFSLHRYNVVTSPYFELTEYTQLKATSRNARLMHEYLSDREKVFFVGKQ